MKIILVTQYYFPETGATSNRIHSLAKYLQSMEHDVTVIAEKPNHPMGVFFPGFERGFVCRRMHDGIPVVYTWVHTRPNKGFLDRVLFYVTFMVTAILGSYWVTGRCDVVIASSPPLFVGPAGWAIAKLKRAKFLFDVRDLWPEVAVSMGELANERVIRIAESLERFLYLKADAITTVTKSFRTKIRALVGGEKPVHLVMNGALIRVVDRLRAGKEHEPSRPGSVFVVVYAGNIGLAQGLLHVCEAARILKQTCPNVRFRLVGDGPKRNDMESRCHEQGLSNVEFVGRVSLEDAFKHMLVADALLVPLANDPIYRMFIPSKLFDGMAAAKPILLSVDGEARSILDDANAGIYYEPENGAALATAVARLSSNPVAAKQMGENGLAVVRRQYSREAQWEILHNVILGLTHDTKSRHLRK